MKYLLVITLSLTQLGFVLISGPDEATLDVTPENPVVTFVWDGNAAELKELEDFEDGAYVGMSDEEVTEQLIGLALQKWTEVPGSFIELELQTSPGSDTDTEDGVHVITVKELENVAIAAYAQPNFEGSIIKDCDISISKNASTAKDMAYTITHELGHCMGLGHPHTNYGAIMGYARNTRNISLGADDMAGMIYLYPDPDYVSGEPNLCGSLGVKDTRAQYMLLLVLMLPLALAIRTKYSS